MSDQPDAVTQQPRSVRILVTGSRTWDQPQVVADALLDTWHDTTQTHGPECRLVVVHGACPTGADRHAALWAFRQDPALVVAEAHPADWHTHGRAAGPRRNTDMVRDGADLCLAFQRNNSRGTADCIRRAEQAGIPVRRFTA